MNKEKILIAIKEIQCRYCLPALEKDFTDKDYAIQQFEKLVIHLANQQEKKDKEIERLDNIIKEVREYIPNCGCDDEAIYYIESILDKENL